MERRSQDRHRTIFRPAYIDSRSGIHFALMRNVSATGACLTVMGEFSIGEEIEYCVANSGPVKAKVAWIDGQDIGVENYEDVADLNFCDDRPYRSVRVPIGGQAKIHVAGLSADCRLSNLSQNGACIDGGLVLPSGTLVTLEIAGHHFESASVKWTDNGRSGIRFASAIDKATMARLLDHFQNRGTRKVQAA